VCRGDAQFDIAINSCGTTGNTGIYINTFGGEKINVVGGGELNEVEHSS